MNRYRKSVLLCNFNFQKLSYHLVDEIAVYSIIAILYATTLFNGKHVRWDSLSPVKWFFSPIVRTLQRGRVYENILSANYVNIYSAPPFHSVVGYKKQYGPHGDS
jgi:hypothetical protein